MAEPAERPYPSAFLIATVALPLLVVAVFLVASAVPRWTVAPPEYDLLLRADSGYNPAPYGRQYGPAFDGYGSAGYEPSGYRSGGHEPDGYRSAGYEPDGYRSAGYQPGHTRPGGYGSAGYEPADRSGGYGSRHYRPDGYGKEREPVYGAAYGTSANLPVPREPTRREQGYGPNPNYSGPHAGSGYGPTSGPGYGSGTYGPPQQDWYWRPSLATVA